MLKQALTGSGFLRHPQPSRAQGSWAENRRGTQEKAAGSLTKTAVYCFFIFIVFWLNHHILLVLPGKPSTSRLLLNIPKTAPPLHGPIAAEERRKVLARWMV